MYPRGADLAVREDALSRGISSSRARKSIQGMFVDLRTCPRRTPTVFGLVEQISAGGRRPLAGSRSRRRHGRSYVDPHAARSQRRTRHVHGSFAIRTAARNHKFDFFEILDRHAPLESPSRSRRFRFIHSVDPDACAPRIFPFARVEQIISDSSGVPRGISIPRMVSRVDVRFFS